MLEKYAGKLPPSKKKNPKKPTTKNQYGQKIAGKNTNTSLSLLNLDNGKITNKTDIANAQAEN